MKKILSALLVAALLCAMFVMPSSAASALANTAADVPHLDKAPAVDGVVSFNEYGNYSSLHSLSANGDQYTDDGGAHDTKGYIEDVNFYIGWTEDSLHMAWVVTTPQHTPFPKGTYEVKDGATYATMVTEDWPTTEEEQAAQLKQMWMFSCVQFIITPGAPTAGSTSYQNDKNFLSIGFCEMDDGAIGKALWGTPYGIDTSDFDYNDWDAAVVRDDAKGTTTYEIAIPAAMCGVSSFGTDAQFGLAYAVGAQEHYYQKGASMVEWQDAILGWPGKADNAGVMTFVGGSGKTDFEHGTLPEGDIKEVEDDTALDAEDSIVYVNNVNSTITDGRVVLMNRDDVSYNTVGNNIAAVLLAPTEDEGYFTVVGTGTSDDEVVVFYNGIDPVATDVAENCIIIAVDDTNAGYETIQEYACGDIIGVWGFKFNADTLVPTALAYSNACVYISEFAAEGGDENPGEGDVSGDVSGETSDPAGDTSSEASTPAGDEPTTPSTPSTNNTTNNSSADDSDDDGDSNVGLIIGIVVGVIVVIGAVVAVIIVMKKKKA